MIESSIGEKKKQLEKLVQEMKEVNLQSLTVSTDEASPTGEGKQSTNSISRFMSWYIWRFCQNRKTDNWVATSAGECGGHEQKSSRSLGLKEKRNLITQYAIIRNMSNDYLAW